MLTVPKEFALFMTTFAPLFTKRVWQPVQVLLIGAILAPGQRTVTTALRVMGLAPSARDHQERGQRPKKLTDWARQMFLVVRRWRIEDAFALTNGSWI